MKKRNKPDKFASLFSDVSAKALGNNTVKKNSGVVVTWMSTPYNHPQQPSSRLLVQQVPSMTSTTLSKRDGLAVAPCRNGRPDFIPVCLAYAPLSDPTKFQHATHPHGTTLQPRKRDAMSTHTLFKNTNIPVFPVSVVPHTFHRPNPRSFSTLHVPMGLLYHLANGMRCRCTRSSKMATSPY